MGWPQQPPKEKVPDISEKLDFLLSIPQIWTSIDHLKVKCPNLLKLLGTIIQENYQPFYPSEPFRITRFQMRHPVSSNAFDIK